MPLLKPIDTNPDFEPKASKALPERLIAGDPSFKTWALDEARDGTVKTGIWEATPGKAVPSKVRPSSSAIFWPASSKSPLMAANRSVIRRATVS